MKSIFLYVFNKTNDLSVWVKIVFCYHYFIIFLDLYLVLHPEGALKLDQPAYVKEIYKLYMQRLEKKSTSQMKKKIRIKSPGRPDQRAKFSKLSSEVSWDNKRFYLR